MFLCQKIHKHNLNKLFQTVLHFQMAQKFRIEYGYTYLLYDKRILWHIKIVAKIPALNSESTMKNFIIVHSIFTGWQDWSWLKLTLGGHASCIVTDIDDIFIANVGM